MGVSWVGGALGLRVKDAVVHELTAPVASAERTRQNSSPLGSAMVGVACRFTVETE